MTDELSILLITAASIGFFHTILGPDHYLPFIVMARAGKWSVAKTTILTILCGLGHVGSSVALGLIGIGFGLAVTELDFLEGFRGNIAGWALIAFGLVYFVWGMRKAYRNRPHEHVHVHADGTVHTHEHRHALEHAHVHEGKAPNMTPWILFTIFVFGPCEPLIPILMYPAAAGSMWMLTIVTAVFGLVTIGTMLALVLLSLYGLSFLPLKKLERYSHALAGASIALCGMAIQFLGL